MAPENQQQPNPEQLEQKPNEPKDDADKQKKDGVKAKHPDVPVALAESETSQEKTDKAMKMIGDKLGDAAKQIKEEFKDANNTNPPDGAIVARMKQVGQDYINGMMKDPNFPGYKYVEGGALSSNKIDKGVFLPGRMFHYNVTKGAGGALTVGVDVSHSDGL